MSTAVKQSNRVVTSRSRRLLETLIQPELSEIQIITFVWLEKEDRVMSLEFVTANLPGVSPKLLA